MQKKFSISRNKTLYIYIYIYGPMEIRVGVVKNWTDRAVMDAARS